MRGVYTLNFAPVRNVGNIKRRALVCLQNRNRRAVDNHRIFRRLGIVISFALRVNVGDNLIGCAFERNLAAADREDNVFVFLRDLRRAFGDFNSVFFGVIGD